MTTPPNMIPVPWATAAQRERNEKKPNQSGEEPCLFCNSPMKETDDQTWWVHMSTGGDLYPNEVEEHEDSQGCFPVGAACAKKVPTTHRTRA